MAGPIASSASVLALSARVGKTVVDAVHVYPRLQLAVGFDANHVWISAQYKELGIRKYTSRKPCGTSIELLHGADTVAVSSGPSRLTVTRGNHSLLVDSPEALETLQVLLRGSNAVYAARATLRELVEHDELRAPEMNLLSALAFVAAIAGDADAPARLNHRFVTINRRPVRLPQPTSGQEYTTEMTAGCYALQRCANQADEQGFLRLAYRRLACARNWFRHAESAWFEYVGCVQPNVRAPAVTFPEPPCQTANHAPFLDTGRTPEIFPVISA
jgi:hypothetical protein